MKPQVLTKQLKTFGMMKFEAMENVVIQSPHMGKRGKLKKFLFLLKCFIFCDRILDCLKSENPLISWKDIKRAIVLSNN